MCSENLTIRFDNSNYYENIPKNTNSHLPEVNISVILRHFVIDGPEICVVIFYFRV